MNKHTNTHPLVSVLMAVYNGEKYINQSIDSILKQTYQDIEFIIVDDASTDSTPNILKNRKAKDNRIIILKNKKNLGLYRSLNIGLNVASGKYVVRIDADDWAYPNRIEQQVSLMNRYPDVVVSGSAVEVCDKNLIVKHIRNYHLDDQSIRKHIFRYSPFAASSTIWQTKIMKQEKFNERLLVSADYELYFRVGLHGKFMNLKKPLIKLRMHNQSLSVTKSDMQLKNTILIRLSAVLLYGYQMNKFDKFYNLIQELFIGSIPVNLRFIIFNFLRRFKLY